MAEELFSRQHDLLRLISNAYDNLKKLGSSKITKGNVKVRLDQLDRNWQKFESQHDDVIKYRNDPSFKANVYFTEDVYTRAETAYFDSKAEFLDLLDRLSAGTSDGGNSSNVENSPAVPGNQKSLPKINLPKFSGRYQEWTPFSDMFLSLVGNNISLQAVEKLHYLKGSLSGDAAKLIAAIPITDENYARAWERLQLRYENRRALINAQLDTLFSIKPIGKKSARELEQLRSTVNDVLEALRALGGEIQHWDFFLVYFVCHRLDADTHEAWELKLGNSTEPPKYEDLNAFLESRVRALENVDARTPIQRSTVSNSGTSPRSTPARVHTATPSRRHQNTTCACCNGNHYISLCPDYRAKTPEQRRELVVQRRLCYNCLGNHTLANCVSAKRCLTCEQQHHTTLHPRTSPSTTPNGNRGGSSGSQEIPGGSATPGLPNALHATVSEKSSPQALLATALVNAVSSDGRKLYARALLDQGSELSFVRESVVQALKLPRSSANIPLSGIGAQTCTTTRGVVTLRLQHRSNPTVEVSVEAHILSRLTGRIPAQAIPADACAHLSDLELADPSFDVPGPIDILLGANIYAHLLHEEIRKTEIHAPVAQRTLLGWVISGPISWSSPPRNPIVVAHGYTCAQDQDLSQLVEQFWSQEQIPRNNRSEISEEDRVCEEHFKNTHSRDPDGRYIVRLPFKSRLENQEESQHIAGRMLGRMQRRFEQNETLKKLYTDFLKEYRVLGHMEELDPRQQAKAYFLPHHGVVRETSVSTKLRVVFNASQKMSDGSTLNDSLHAGPKLQTDLMDVLLRWRTHPFVFSTDVEKMYRQVRVHPEDQIHQCIVWNEDPSKSADAYKLCTVTYGMNCAPYLALRVVKQLAEDEGSRFPSAAEVVRNNSYVDDLLGGSDDVATTQEKVKQVDNLFKAGGFVLKKWVANDDRVLCPIEEDRRLPVEKAFDDQDTLRALGLKWNPTSDSFIFCFKEDIISTPSITKRSILSVTARLFDPLGWLAPIVVNAKIFLQELWRHKLQWDDPLPESLAVRWSNFASELKTSAPFVIPRWLGTLQTSSVELHGFSDASRVALAAAVYIRVVEDDFTARSTLLVAKTRVAPLKPVTIARLELSAAVLLTQLVTHAQECLGLPNLPTHLWTDSSVALTWIRGNPFRWKEYVCNRVALIKDLQPNARWHHVAGEENPADAASRGISPKQLQEQASWWSGPEWLRLPSTAWPNSFPLVSESTNLEERAAVVLTATGTRPSEIWGLIDDFSRLERLLRVTALVLEAVSRMRRSKKNVQQDARILSPELLNNALHFWIRKTQQAHFPAELSALLRGSDLPRSSPLARLSPFLDANGLLRLGGRLHKSTFNEDAKHPFILPQKSALSTLLVDRAHRRTLHGGTQLTLSVLREQTWIIGGRVAVKLHIRKCISCTRHRGALLQQKMGQLPSTRLTPARPFLNSGVDYAGPFVVRTWRGRNPKTYKAYLVLFICFATSAVHLELTTDYTTSGFLAAFRRFTGRRGRCARLTSDCGTNFVGADAALKEMFDAACKEFVHLRAILASDGTEWVFNPPSAPHFGGKWEAAVKSVKHHLRRVVGETQLTYEEFSTVLVQIEGVLNSRPLCPLSDDPTDVTALTPGHFLTGEALTSFPEPTLSHIPSSRLDMFQRVRQMLEHFWTRWSREYLQRFQTVSKWLLPDSRLRVGSLVLVADERFPPSKWPLARVVEVHPGSDGLVRVASVKMASGTIFKRPIVKLCLLPVSSDEDTR